MPRIARKDSQSCYYHIIVQGLNREYIFKKKEYLEQFKKIILEKLKESKVTILSYCLMNNHAHFLIYAEKCEYLSKYMQRINIKYSQFYNKINNRVGYVFRDRFYSQEIVSQSQLYNCMRYIHNNPVKACMCKSMGEYTYSSYNEFIYGRNIINDKSIKLLFGSDKDYIEEFNYIHNRNDSKDFEEFLDIKEKEITDFVKEVERKYNRDIAEMRKDKDILEKVIKEARKQTDVTIMKLSELLDISKSSVWMYANK